LQPAACLVHFKEAMHAAVALPALPPAHAPVTEPEVLALLERGRHREAFEGLMPIFRDRVFRLAWAMLGNRAAAEDVAQDTFINVWRGLPRFDGRAALGTWIYAITRNTALMELRRRRDFVSLDAPEGSVGAMISGSLAGDDGRPPEAHGVERLLAQLPDSQRRVVTLFYLEDRSCEAVAEELGMPVGTVKNHLFRARKALSALVGPAGGAR
jgi:RNA polymerase sigma-70 factor (ECF subfamily)